MARRSRIPPDDVGPLIVSGALFELVLEPNTRATAYAEPIEFIDFARSCDEILESTPRLEIPVASDGAPRRYSLLLQVPWVTGALDDDSELRTMTCGPISRDRLVESW
ncbi:MAG: hypothetical protein LJF04_10235 [Gemmatimonadetes bacterium]|nr:hypothetical protein [Gemmatimonadota bacterium]